MQTHQIHVSGARERVHEIRSRLFDFHEVLEVFVTGRSDVLVVVHAGRPRPSEWLRALRGLGYRTPARDHARWPRLERRPEPLLRAVVRSGNQELMMAIGQPARFGTNSHTEGGMPRDELG